MSVQAQHYDVILSPVITEKSTRVSEFNQVVFRVRTDASKPEIKAAVEKIFGVTVEASDGEHSGQVLGQQVHHGGSALGIAGGGDVADRLVEGEIDHSARALERLAVELDLVEVGLDRQTDFGHFTVDAHAARADQGLTVAARAHPGGSHHFL